MFEKSFCHRSLAREEGGGRRHLATKLQRKHLVKNPPKSCSSNLLKRNFGCVFFPREGKPMACPSVPGSLKDYESYFVAFSLASHYVDTRAQVQNPFERYIVQQMLGFFYSF